MGIELINLKYEINNKKIIKNITGFLPNDKLTVLFGPNGSGKTVLLKIISGILKNYTGNVVINNRNIKKYSHKELSNIIGYVPPNSYSVFNYTVTDYILMGKVASKNVFYTPTRKDREKVEEILKKLEIYHLKDNDYNSLSTGERQLVLIGRCLIKKLPIILLDEPVSNLDFYNQHKIFSIIKALKDNGTFVIVSIHDPTLALKYGENMILLKKGQIYDIVHMKQNNKIEVFYTYLNKIYNNKVDIIQNSDRYFVDMP